MTDLEALHRAVLLTPDDDLPRLVLADALDMTGDPKGAERAAFIRLHVEYAREHRKTYRARLERKIRDAMKGVVPFRAWPWLNEILDGTRFGLTVDGWRYAIGGAAGRVHVRRGFVERVECRLAYFVEHAADFFARWPVQRVVLLDCDPFDDPQVSDYVELVGPAEPWRWVADAAATRPDRNAWELPPAMVRTGGGFYESRRAAYDALSADAVAWGRSLVPGLEPAAAGGRVG